MFGFKKEVVNEEESNANKLKIIKEIKKKGEYFIHHELNPNNSNICFVLHRRFPYNPFGTQWDIGANYIGVFKTEAEARKAHKHILKKDIKL